AICEYLDLKTELAETLSSEAGSDGGNGGSAPRIIHTLLARTEERVAATIDAQSERISRLRDDVRTIAAMLDRAYLSYLAHTPEVEREFRNAAPTSALRRHASWLRSVETFLRAGGGDPSVILEMEQS